MSEERPPMTRELAETFLKQIEAAIDDIREDGFHPRSGAWYALDRFQSIARLATEAASHSEGVGVPDTREV